MATANLTDSMALITYEEVKRHATPNDCWLVIHGHVYDLSQFEHPGGAAIILKYSGRDATTAFDEIHAPGIVKALAAERHLGPVDLSSKIEVEQPQDVALVPATNATSKPNLHTLISVHDFEKVAHDFYTPKAWAFYSSAGSDLVSHQANLHCHRKLMLRPRVLRNVESVRLDRQILGCRSSTPFFVSPAAMARLAHTDGELALARGCGEEGIIQTISSNASYPLHEVIGSGRPDQPFFLQLYVNSDRSKTEELLKSARELGVKAVFVTIDAPVPGKREADERIAAENVAAAISGAVAQNDRKGGGLGRVMAKYIDATLCWKDLAWIKQVSGLPVVLKGIQTAEDARKAVDYDVAGIFLGNHGGRSLDTTQPSMLTLLELHRCCPEVFSKLEVYVDGGFTRGTDILKAIALGATAVGIGRPWLYALAYGQEGVQHMSEIFKDELVVAMKQSGIVDVDAAHPGMVNTALLEPLIRTGKEHPWIAWRPRCRL